MEVKNDKSNNSKQSVLHGYTVNEDVPFDEMFNGTTFPAYYCEPNSVAGIEISYYDLTELVELPCEDIAIKKALCRLGAGSVMDCKITTDLIRDVSDEWSEKISEVEKTKDLFGLNRLLKNEDIRMKQEQPVSIFNKEVTRRLRENDFAVSKGDNSLNVMTADSYSVKVFENGSMRVPEDCPSDSYSQIKRIMKEAYNFCSAYAKAAPLKADGLSDKYRCLAEFNDTVLAAKYSEEYGFEFVTWDRTFDGKGVTQGNYYSDYSAAKENFATRSGLIDKDKLFSTEEFVMVNHWGTVITREPIEGADEGIVLEDEDYNYLGEDMTLDEFANPAPVMEQTM